MPRPSPGCLRRRDFLGLGSVAAGAALFPKLAQAAPAAGSQLAIDRLSVGFVDGSDRLDDVFSLPWQNVPDEEREEQWVVPAEGLTVGDSSMAYQMVAVKVHGLYPAMPPRRLATLQSAYLTVYHHLPWLGFEKPLPHLAWGAAFGARPTAGSPNRFLVPTTADGSLEMTLDLIPAPKRGGPARHAIADFTVDPWAGRPKLQRGIYLLGLGDATFFRDQAIPADPEAERWDMLSLVISVDKVEEGEI